MMDSVEECVKLVATLCDMCGELVHRLDRTYIQITPYVISKRLNVCRYCAGELRDKLTQVLETP